jgi:aryl-alcohol dehydrogenase-like predicted oxidoreductase
MEYRHLGRSGVKVSAFSFGAMTFGGAGRFSTIGSTKGAEAARQVDMCLDAGVNLFDTADVYSEGQSEEILAEALGKRRPKVLIATKAFGATGRGVNDLGASRQHLVAACDASLKRLRTDYIDLYQIHNQDMLTPTEETLRALDDLVRSGRVRYIGSSNHAGWTKMRALATSDRLGLARYVSQQIQYSLISREAEDELLPLGVSEGVGALIWGPLAGGYLSGKFRSGSHAGETRIGGTDRLAGIDDERAHRVLGVMDEIAAARPGASLSQIALNWVARRPGVSSIILGARTTEQLADNLAAAAWSLTDDEMARLDAASDTQVRYPYMFHRSIGAARNPPLSLLPPIGG